MKIFVLIIEHSHGRNTSVHRTDVEANEEVEYYCRGEWQKEIRDEPMPEDQGQLIAEYFERVESESFEICEFDIAPAAREKQANLYTLEIDLDKFHTERLFWVAAILRTAADDIGTLERAGRSLGHDQRISLRDVNFNRVGTHGHSARLVHEFT